MINLKKIILEEIGDFDWTKKAVPMEEQNPEDWVGRAFGYGQELKDDLGHYGRGDEDEIFEITGIDVNGNLKLKKWHDEYSYETNLGCTVNTLRNNISDGTWVWV